jgi:NTE family protein
MKKIALVLGSGGARGLAHIGVLKVLERGKIPVDIIAGTSIGALIGGFYAAGMSASDIEKIGLKIKTKEWLSFIDMTILGMGLIKGEKIKKFLYKIVGKRNIEDLPILFSAIAADIGQGTHFVIEEGDLVKAIRASISIAGLFKPVKYKNRYLIDGGVVNPVPVDVAKKNKADKIIAVNVCTNVGMNQPGNSLFKGSRRRYSMYEVFARGLYMMENEVAKAKLSVNPPDVLIKPGIDSINILSFQKIKQAIDAGEKAAEDVMPQIKHIVKRGLF